VDRSANEKKNIRPHSFISFTDRKSFNYLFSRNAAKLKTQNKHPTKNIFSAFFKK